MPLQRLDARAVAAAPPDDHEPLDEHCVNSTLLIPFPFSFNKKLLALNMSGMYDEPKMFEGNLKPYPHVERPEVGFMLSAFKLLCFVNLSYFLDEMVAKSFYRELEV